MQGIQIGPLQLNFYGLIIMVGVIAAAVLAHFEAKRRHLPIEVITDSLVWVVLGGIVGARLWHIFTPTSSNVAQGLTTKYYLTHPLAAIAIWRGGLGIPGAIAGGALAFYIFAKKRGLSFGLWADIFAPGLALGQAIGRWGNFVNQEVYGRPTNLPWAITIDPAHRLPEFMSEVTYHPLFLYESLFNLLNMGFLLLITRKFAGKLKEGDVFLTYLISYPIFRFFMEFLRLDASFVAGINANQTIMLVIALLSGALIFYRHKIKPDVKDGENSLDHDTPMIQEDEHPDHVDG